MLVNAKLLNPSSTQHAEPVRLAVIQGFLERAFPRDIKLDFNTGLESCTPSIEEATAMASRLGIYIPVSDLQTDWRRTLLANRFAVLGMTYLIWLCPHCFTKIDNSKLRWGHVVEFHREIIQKHL